MPQTAGAWGIKDIMHKIKNFKLKRTAKRPIYRISNTSNAPTIQMDPLVQYQEPEIYKKKVKVGDEFELFDKLSERTTNGRLIPVVLGWLKTHNHFDKKLLSDDCGVVPNTMIKKALHADVSTDAQLAVIVNEYISNGAPLNVFRSLTALVISYVVWYQKRLPEMQNTKKNIGVIEDDYTRSVQFLATQPKKYISDCMRVLDDYLHRFAAKYGQSPYAKQTHILKAANNIHKARLYQPVAPKLSMGTRRTTRRRSKTRKSASASRSGSYLDPFAPNRML